MILQFPPFNRVYDGQDVFLTNKADMTQYPPSSLKKGDVVLVETFVVRWPRQEKELGAGSSSTVAETSKEGGKGKGKSGVKGRREWTSWNIDFRLDCVSIIFKGSNYATEDSTIGDNDGFAA